MPLMPLPLRGTPPTQAVAINRANPLTTGLSLCVIPVQGLAPTDLVSAGPAATGPGIFVPQGGLALANSGAGPGWMVTTAATDGLQASMSAVSFPATFGCVFIPDTVTASSALVNYANGAAGNVNARLGLRVNASGVFAAYSYNAGGTLGEAVTTVAPVAGAVNAAVAVHVSGSSRQVYANGTTGTANTTSALVSGTTTFNIGSAAGTTRENGQTGVYLLVCMWRRPLTPDEALSFTLNPWQLFVAAPSRLLSMVVPNSVRALTGQAVTTASGLLVPALDMPLTGQALTTAAGAMAPGVTTALAGQAVATSTGTITASQGSGGDKTVALSGSSVTTKTGSMYVTVLNAAASNVKRKQQLAALDPHTSDAEVLRQDLEAERLKTQIAEEDELLPALLDAAMALIEEGL
jgi:hypothetical protein